jgi:hypothetical protein
MPPKKTPAKKKSEETKSKTEEKPSAAAETPTDKSAEKKKAKRTYHIATARRRGLHILEYVIGGHNGKGGNRAIINRLVKKTIVKREEIVKQRKNRVDAIAKIEKETKLADMDKIIKADTEVCSRLDAFRRSYKDKLKAEGKKIAAAAKIPGAEVLMKERDTLREDPNYKPAVRRLKLIKEVEAYDRILKGEDVYIGTVYYRTAEVEKKLKGKKLKDDDGKAIKEKVIYEYTYRGVRYGDSDIFIAAAIEQLIGDVLEDIAKVACIGKTVKPDHKFVLTVDLVTAAIEGAREKFGDMAGVLTNFIEKWKRDCPARKIEEKINDKGDKTRTIIHFPMPLGIDTSATGLGDYSAEDVRIFETIRDHRKFKKESSATTSDDEDGDDSLEDFLSQPSFVASLVEKYELNIGSARISSDVNSWATDFFNYIFAIIARSISNTLALPKGGSTVSPAIALGAIDQFFTSNGMTTRKGYYDSAMQAAEAAVRAHEKKFGKKKEEEKSEEEKSDGEAGPAPKGAAAVADEGTNE